MSPSEPGLIPIPPLLWARLRAFLSSGATGQVILHVQDGEVTKLELVEVVRAPKPRPRGS